MLSGVKPFAVGLDEIRPTQMAVGMRAVEHKRRKVERRSGPRKMSRYLERRPIPAVVGPGDDYYIIDRHHLSLALWKSGVEEAYVTLVGDFSHLSEQRFFRLMTQLGWLNLFDATGNAVSPCRLPPTIAELQCDPYRDLAWSVRKASGFHKSMEPFAEFRWADFFRQRIPMPMLTEDFAEAHKLAMRLARSANAKSLPGFRPKAK